MRMLSTKRGFVATLPFIAILFLFIILSIISIVLALFLSVNSNDKIDKTLFSVGSLPLDIASIKTPTSDYAKLLSDPGAYFSAEPSSERALIEFFLSHSTESCYELSFFNEGELRATYVGSQKTNAELCKNVGLASVVILPQQSIFFRIHDVSPKPLPGVSVK